MPCESTGGQKSNMKKPSLFQSLSEPPSRMATQIHILNKLGPVQDQQDLQCLPGITILNTLGTLGSSIRSLAILHFSGMLGDVSKANPCLQDTSDLWNKPFSQLTCGGYLQAAGDASKSSWFMGLSPGAHWHLETYHCFGTFPIWA